MLPLKSSCGSPTAARPMDDMLAGVYGPDQHRIRAGADFIMPTLG
mgnify:CR=1 FL=1